MSPPSFTTQLTPSVTSVGSPRFAGQGVRDAGQAATLEAPPLRAQGVAAVWGLHPKASCRASSTPPKHHPKRLLETGRLGHHAGTRKRSAANHPQVPRPSNAENPQDAEAKGGRARTLMETPSRREGLSEDAGSGSRLGRGSKRNQKTVGFVDVSRWFV